MNKQYKGVMISSGHHGKGMCLPGACAYNRKEAQLAKDLMTELAKKLKKIGIVTKTYTDNAGINVASNIANITQYHRAQDTKQQYLHISIHYNAANSIASGSEVLYRGDMQNKASVFAFAIANALGIKNRGAKKRTDLGFLNTLSTRGYDPLLFEIAFIDNASDMAAHDKYYVDLVDAIANCIAQYCVSSQSAPDKGAENGSKENTHTVVSGDTLYSVARNYSTTVDKLVDLNPIKFKGNANTPLKVGWRIKLK